MQINHLNNHCGLQLTHRLTHSWTFNTRGNQQPNHLLYVVSHYRLVDHRTDPSLICLKVKRRARLLVVLEVMGINRRRLDLAVNYRCGHRWSPHWSASGRIMSPPPTLCPGGGLTARRRSCRAAPRFGWRCRWAPAGCAGAPQGSGSRPPGGGT